jgi:hypothetical protein
LERRAFTYVALALLVWAISGTATAGYYFTQYNTYQYEYRNLSKVMEFVSLRVNMFVSYGNGTKVWHNDTALPIGSTAFTAILAVADVRYKDYGGDLGILVTSIDGLAGNSTHGWFYWYRETGKSEWVFSESSCAEYILHRGDTIAFTYQSYGTTWPPPFSP